MVFLTDPEKSTEGHDRIGNFTAALVEHDVVDMSDLVAKRIVDRCSLNAIRADERIRFQFGILWHVRLQG